MSPAHADGVDRVIAMAKKRKPSMSRAMMGFFRIALTSLLVAHGSIAPPYVMQLCLISLLPLPV